MAKSSKYIQLSSAQKDEIRRLTQKANRRITAFTKEYENYGLELIPREVSGGIQHRKQWQTEDRAFSRSVKFETVEDYKKQLNKLKKFDRKNEVGTVKEYTKYGQDRLIEAMRTITHGELPEGTEANIRKMSAGVLAHFWDEFERRAIKLKQEFSSGDELEAMLSEVFPEDLTASIEKSANMAQKKAQSKNKKKK